MRCAVMKVLDFRLVTITMLLLSCHLLISPNIYKAPSNISSLICLIYYCTPYNRHHVHTKTLIRCMPLSVSKVKRAFFKSLKTNRERLPDFNTPVRVLELLTSTSHTPHPGSSVKCAVSSTNTSASDCAGAVPVPETEQREDGQDYWTALRFIQPTDQECFSLSLTHILLNSLL